MKDNIPSVVHLKWLVEARGRNQRSALRLFELFDKNTERLSGSSYNRDAQTMLAICFSLWRSAFLADRTGMTKAAFKDARRFLGKVLTDNAINYPQDRDSREWTFNYYVIMQQMACFLFLGGGRR